MADDIARLGYEIDSSQARTAASDLDKLTAASAKTATGYTNLKKASTDLLRDEQGRFMSAQKAADTYGAEIDALRRKYVPLYDASQRFAASQTEIKRALELGAISAKQADAAMTRLQSQYVATGAAARTMGKGVQASTQHATNLMFQFQDISMMLAAGQNPLMLAMQQGTQVSGVFQQMKNSGQSAFSGIKAGLLAMVSPMSLLTIGVIAGGAALVQWGVAAFGAGENAGALAEKLSTARENAAALNEELRQMHLGVTSDELAMMDAVAAQLERVRKAEANLAANQGPTARNHEMILATEQEHLAVLQEQLASLRNNQAEKARLIASTNELADAERQVWSQSNMVTQSMRETEQIARLLKAGINASVIEAMRLAGVDMASPIDAATESAARLASNLGIALDAAMRIENFQKTADMSDEDRAMAVPFDNRRAKSLADSARLQYENAQAALASKKGASAGRSAAKKAETEAKRLAKQRESELEALVTSLQTERELIDVWEKEQLSLIGQYSDAELEALGGKNAAKERLEAEHQDRMAAIMDRERQERMAGFGHMFGDLATLMQTGNDKLFKIGQAAAIAGAVMDGWEAAVSAWKWGMKVGGIPLAAAASAASLVRTGVMISNIAAQSPRSSSSGGGGSSSAPSSASGTSTTAQPERVVRLNITGPDFAREWAEEIATSLFDATQDGTRVVIAR